MQKEHEDRFYDAMCHPKTHAIIAAMLGREPKTSARFLGKATITSDGFAMCNFVDGAGYRHYGAFVGSWEEIEDNIQLVGEELSIPEDETREALKSWIATDYRPSNHLRGALGI